MDILFVRWLISDGFVRQSKRALNSTKASTPGGGTFWRVWGWGDMPTIRPCPPMVIWLSDYDINAVLLNDFIIHSEFVYCTTNKSKTHLESIFFFPLKGFSQSFQSKGCLGYHSLPYFWNSSSLLLWRHILLSSTFPRIFFISNTVLCPPSHSH